MFVSYVLIILRLFSYFLKFFHKLGSFLCIFLFKKIVFYFIKLLPEQFLCNLIFIIVNLCINSFFNLLTNSILGYFFKSCYYTFRNFLVVNFFDRVDNSIRMELFYHGQIFALYLNIRKCSVIYFWLEAKNLVISALRQFVTEYFSCLS